MKNSVQKRKSDKSKTYKRSDDKSSSFGQVLTKIIVILVIMAIITFAIYFILDYALNSIGKNGNDKDYDVANLITAISDSDYDSALEIFTYLSNDSSFPTEDDIEKISDTVGLRIKSLVGDNNGLNENSLKIFNLFHMYINKSDIEEIVSDLFTNLKTTDMNFNEYENTLMILNDAISKTDFSSVTSLYSENANIIQQSRESYKNALAYEKTGDIADAYYSYISVSEQDVFNYDNAQKNAIRLKDDIINEILDSARTFESENDYENAYYTIKSAPDIVADDKRILEYADYITPLFQMENYYEYTGIVYNMFFHSLALNPDKAFSSSRGKELFEIMATRYEFIKTVELLYENDFILINASDLYDTYIENGVTYMKLKTVLMLPKNKKPLLLSFDNMACTFGNVGFCKKIIIDDNGNLASIEEINGIDTVTYDGEHVLILLDFVEKHPDFSYNGAMATIGMSGYENMFGYETAKPGTAGYDEQISCAKLVADKLKQSGFVFANHSYYHYSSSKDIPSSHTDVQWLEYDTLLWEQYIEPVLGKTDIYITPGGKNYSVTKYVDGDKSDPCYNYLVSKGYIVILSVGRSQSYTNNIIGVENPRYFFKTSLFMDRYNIDGKSLYKTDITLSGVFGFSQQEIIDPVRNDYMQFIS